MKKDIFKIAYLLLPVALLFQSCNKYIDTDINTDPNAPAKVPLNLLLPTAEVGTVQAEGSDFILPTLYWMQQLEGVASQAGNQEAYSYVPTDGDNLWKWEMYAGVMMDCHQMMGQAETEKAPYYKGIAQTIMAYDLMQMTDLFGDIPYTKAFKGSANYHPTYDSQESIYKTILPNLLDSAIIELSKPASDNSVTPGGDDLIYAGDNTKWIKLAYSLKARLYIHLSKVSPSDAFTNALASVAKAFTSNDDDAILAFGSTETNANPIYQMNEQRTGYIGGLGAKLVDMMNGGTPDSAADDDPRLKIYADTTGTNGSWVGYAAGAPAGAACQIGTYFSSISSPISVISYVEVKFIEAEALFQTGDLAGAANAFNEAVKKSLEKYGVSDTVWESTNANETNLTITLAKIMNAKYVALYLNSEVYNDWRRHDDVIVITPAAGNLTKNIVPRRFLYPNDEISNNKANVPIGITITNKVWWDK